MQILESKFEILCLFIEGSAGDWFEIILQSRRLPKPWSSWKNSSFLDTFAGVSWSDVSYAYTFLYYSGSFIDYTLKKSKLLLPVYPEIPESVQNHLIVIKLLTFITTKLDRNVLKSRDKLMTQLTKVDSYNNPKMGTSKKTNTNTNFKIQTKTDSTKP